MEGCTMSDLASQLNTLEEVVTELEDIAQNLASWEREAPTEEEVAAVKDWVISTVCVKLRYLIADVRHAEDVRLTHQTRIRDMKSAVNQGYGPLGVPLTSGLLGAPHNVGSDFD
jgi:hypothetical protein